MINCHCETETHGKCSRCSRIKMVVGLKRKFHHLKVNEKLPTFYSFLKDDKKNDSEVIAIMKKRMLHHLEGTYNIILFYNNHTNKLIEKCLG